MKERPILFNGEMVQAILEGRKTQTRRVVKPQPEYIESSGRWVWPIPKSKRHGCGSVCSASREWHEYLLPHQKPNQVGDRLWVREAWNVHPAMDGWRPSDIPAENTVSYMAGPDCFSGFGKTRPSIFMPRWASRITLEITGVRVERLQDISEADAEAEGVHSDDDYPTDSACLQCSGEGVHGSVGPNLGFIEVDCKECDTAKKRFRNLWDSINGPDSWAANPWVWVVEFKQVSG